MENWNKLSMYDRANYIRMGVASGLTKLSDIHKAYNTFAEGGYLDWINKVKEWRPGILLDIDADEPTYDYEGFFMEDPERAWKMLDGDPEAHFTDKYKKPNHPTFSDESIYSTPETLGGHWVENYGGTGRWVYEPSEYTKSHKEDTLKYLRGTGEGYLDGMNVVFTQKSITPDMLFNKYDEGGPVKAIDTKAYVERLPDGGYNIRPNSELINQLANHLKDTAEVLQGSGVYVRKASDVTSWLGNSIIIDPAGEKRSVEEILRTNPNYTVYTDRQGRALSKEELSTLVDPLQNRGQLLDKAAQEAVRKDLADKWVHNNFNLESWKNFLGTEAAGVIGSLGAYGLAVTSPIWAPLVVTNIGLPWAAGTSWDMLQRAVTGTTSTETVSNYLLNKWGWDPTLAEITGGLTNPGYWINFAGAGKWTEPLFNKIGIGVPSTTATEPLSPMALSGINSIMPKSSISKAMDAVTLEADKLYRVRKIPGTNMSVRSMLKPFKRGFYRQRIDALELAREVYNTIINNAERAHPGYKYDTSRNGLYRENIEPNDIPDVILLRLQKQEDTGSFTNPFTGLVFPWTQSPGQINNVRITYLSPGQKNLSKLTQANYTIPVKENNELAEQISKYINSVNSKIGDNARIGGSTVIYGRGYSPGTPNDLELVTTEGRLKDLVSSMDGTSLKPHGDYGYRFNSKYLIKNEPIDVLVIKEDTNGLVYGPLAHEYFKLLYPNEYREIVRDAVERGVKGDVIPLDELRFPITAEELYSKITPEVQELKLLLDMFLSDKTKHVQRAFSALTNPNKELRDEAREAMIKAIKTHFGDNYKLASLYFTNLDLTNIEANKAFLKELGISEKAASDPDLMRNIIDRWYIANTTLSRTVFKRKGDTKYIENMLDLEKALQTIYAPYNSHSSGIGGNTVIGGGSQVIGGDFTSIMQQHLTLYPERIKTVKDLLTQYNKLKDRSSDIYKKIGALEDKAREMLREGKDPSEVLAEKELLAIDNDMPMYIGRIYRLLNSKSSQIYSGNLITPKQGSVSPLKGEGQDTVHPETGGSGIPVKEEIANWEQIESPIEEEARILRTLNKTKLKIIQAGDESYNRGRYGSSIDKYNNNIIRAHNRNKTLLELSAVVGLGSLIGVGIDKYNKRKLEEINLYLSSFNKLSDDELKEQYINVHNNLKGAREQYGNTYIRVLNDAYYKRFLDGTWNSTKALGGILDINSRFVLPTTYSFNNPYYPAVNYFAEGGLESHDRGHYTLLTEELKIARRQAALEERDRHMQARADRANRASSTDDVSDVKDSSQISLELALILGALDSLALLMIINKEVEDAYNRKKALDEELRRGYMEDLYDMYEKALKSIELASSLYSLGNFATLHYPGLFTKTPRLNSFLGDPTGLRTATVTGLGADIGQIILNNKKGDTFGVVKNSVEAGLGTLGTLGAFNVYKYLPSKYQKFGLKLDTIIDWTNPGLSISSLF